MTKLISIAGWAHHASALDPLVKPLREDVEIHQTSAAALRGNAGCNAPFSTYADALITLLTHTDQPSILLGWSMGALIALEAAIARPEAVKGLILISATSRFCRNDDYRHGTPENAIHSMTHALRQSPLVTLNAFFRRVYSADKPTDDQLAKAISQALSFGMGSLVHGLDYLRSADMRGRLSEATSPTLLLHGKKDRIVPCGAATYLDERLPDSRLVVVDEAGHTLPMTHSETILPIIREFLEQVS